MKTALDKAVQKSVRSCKRKIVAKINRKRKALMKKIEAGETTFAYHTIDAYDEVIKIIKEMN